MRLITPLLAALAIASALATPAHADPYKWCAVYGGFGNDSINGGSGLTNMRDRLVALGGDMSIQSAPRQGTVVTGRVYATE